MRQPGFFALIAAMVAALSVAGCSGEIYLRDGVTDGDTFYLAERALSDPDPVLQSWVRYSLSRSTCQLQIGGDNPARESSFDCELAAREHLLEAWSEHGAQGADASDRYLDELVEVRDAGYLREYVAENFQRRGWRVPPNLDRHGFRDWRREHLPRHRPATRITGSWNYAHNVNSQHR